MKNKNSVKTLIEKANPSHQRLRMARYEHIVSLIEKKHNNTVLDLGCGLAPISYMLPRDNKLILVDRLTGDDFFNGRMGKDSHNRVFSSIPNHPNAELKDWDLDRELPIPDKSVDLVIASSVMPYIKNIHLFLDNIHRVLKKNGIVVGDVTNSCSLTNRLKWLFGKLPSRSAHPYYVDMDRHINNFTFRSIENLFRQQGFIIKTSSMGLWHGDTKILPSWAIKKTFSHAIIFKASK